MDKPLSAYRGDAPYVFVCYAHDDARTIYPELAWLQDEGVNVWYDEGISGGRVWHGHRRARMCGSRFSAGLMWHGDCRPRTRWLRFDYLRVQRRFRLS